MRLKDPSSTVYFQSIMGTYSHLGWVRTENPELGIIKITATDDFADDVRRVLEGLKSEIDFQEVEF